MCIIQIILTQVQDKLNKEMKKTPEKIYLYNFFHNFLVITFPAISHRALQEEGSYSSIVAVTTMGILQRHG